MNLEDLIPTFEVGERVILDYHNVERYCSECGEPWYNLFPPFKLSCVVKGTSDPNAFVFCSKCGHNMGSMGNGFYNLIADNGEWFAPYTLLERIQTPH